MPKARISAIISSDGQNVQRTVLAAKRGERRAVAGDMMRGEPVRDRRRHREVNERHQRQILAAA